MNLEKEDRDQIEEEAENQGEDNMENEISSVDDDIDPQIWKGDDDFNQDEEDKDDENPDQKEPSKICFRFITFLDKKFDDLEFRTDQDLDKEK